MIFAAVVTALLLSFDGTTLLAHMVCIVWEANKEGGVFCVSDVWIVKVETDGVVAAARLYERDKT